MSFFTQLASTTILAFAVSSASFAQEAPSADTVVATVDGKEITLGHIIVLAERLPAQYTTVPPADLYQGILDQMIQQSVLGSAIEVSDKRLLLSSENEARAFAATAALDAISATSVSQEQVEVAYGKFVATSPAEPQFLASHILVDTKEAAMAVIKMVNEGVDFAQAARENSTGPSGPSGGDLGWFGRGAMVPAFDAAVADMEVGAVSEPTQTTFGWHVIKLNDRRDHASLEEMYEELAAGLREDAIDAEIAKLEEAAEIVRVEPTFDFVIIKDGSLVD